MFTQSDGSVAFLQRPDLRDAWLRAFSPVLAVARYRFVVLTLGVLAVSWLHRTACPVDLIEFSDYGRQLVTGHWAAVYPDSWNQGGPLELLGAVAFQPTGYAVGPLLVLHIVGNTAALAVVLGAARVCRRTHGLSVSPVAELATGAAVLVWLEPMLWRGHLAELLIPALWLAAADLVRRGRGPTAALLIGLSAGVETWGILALPLLLADGGIRRIIRSGVLAVAVAVAQYLPFVLSGHFGMFGHVWPISDFTWVHWLWPNAEGFTWWMRMAQGALTMLGSAAVVLTLRRRPDVVWIAPLSVLLLRMLADPTMYAYYWNSVLLVVLVGAGTVSRATPLPLAVSLMALGYLPFLRGDAGSFRELVLVETLVVALVAGLTLLRTDGGAVLCSASPPAGGGSRDGTRPWLSP